MLTAADHCYGRVVVQFGSVSRTAPKEQKYQEKQDDHRANRVQGDTDGDPGDPIFYP